MKPYQLLGAEVSYYTGKARAYLRYKTIPFKEILATRDVYSDQIIPRVGWPVIPVVITPNGETLQDTTVIIDTLETVFPEPSVYPSSPRQKLLALLFEAYGDEWLKLPAMHYRWNHCYDWILTEFGRLSAPEKTAEEQLEIGRKNAGRFHGSLPFLGVHKETEAAIEESYEEFLVDFDHHLQDHTFLLGSLPSIGDFGLFGALYAHLYRDPYPGELMKEIAPNVAKWVESLIEGPQQSGTFLANDEIPDTLWPLLERWAVEYAPVLIDTAAQFNEWAQANLEQDAAPTELPRTIGSHPFTLLHGEENQVSSERAVFPYDLWMLQRATDHLASLSTTDAEACRAVLASVGAEALADLKFPRIDLVNYRLAA